MLFRTAIAFLALVLACGVSPVGAAENDRYDVRQYGAVGDGEALDTVAIQTAINVCAEAGGGTVFFPPGTYRAGAIQLKSNITLHVPKGARLLQSKKLDDYAQMPPTCYVHGLATRFVFIHGKDVENVSLIGQGVIDGNLAMDPTQPPGCRGPMTILFENCKRLLLQDLTIVDSPSCPAVFYGCQAVNYIRVIDLKGHCGGITFTCCQDVLVDGMVSDGSGDDALCIKNECPQHDYAYRPECGFLTENILIENTTIRNTTHPAIKLGTGSFGVFRNITVKNCVFENTGDMFTIQLMRKTYKDTRERVMENITFSDVKVTNVGRLLDVTCLDVTEPIIRNMLFENVVVDGFKEPSVLWGLPDAPINNVTLKNIKMRGKANPFWLKTRYLNGLTLTNVDLELSGAESVLICEQGTDLEVEKFSVKGTIGKDGEGTIMEIDQVKGVSVHDCRVPPVRTFLCARGDQTGDIRLPSNKDLVPCAMPFVADQAVPAEAVSPRAKDVAYANLKVSEEIKANEAFKARVAVTNRGSEGVLKVEVRVDSQVAGSQWIALKEGENRDLTVTTRPYYRPGSYTIAVGPLEATAVVRPTPPAFEFGERMRISSPAAAGELTVVSVPLKNIGGKKGVKEVELYADDEVVAAKQVALEPGEEKEVTIEHRFEEAGPHKLKLGDFPVWSYATFANTRANFYQTRQAIIIEAGGGENRIIHSKREYGVVYLKDVKGDFVATTSVTQRATGQYGGGGLIVKNDLTKPADNAGFGFARVYPKYDVAGFERGPSHFKLAKDPKYADILQDVGIYVTAYSTRNQLARATFQHFKVQQKK